MEYSYKFRIYPNIAQAQQIHRTFGCCRFVWNHYLAQRIEAYRETEKSPTRFMQDKDLTSLKKQEKTIWLREVDATALQSSLRDLDTAYQNFFRRVKRARNPDTQNSKANETIDKAIRAGAWAQISKYWKALYSSPSWER